VYFKRERGAPHNGTKRGNAAAVHVLV